MFKVLRGTTNTNTEPLLVYKWPFTQNMFLHQKKTRGKGSKTCLGSKTGEKKSSFFFFNAVKCIGE